MVKQASRTKDKDHNNGSLWTKKRLWIALVMGLVLICIYTIPRFPFGPYVLYSDRTAEIGSSKKIKFEKLTSEQDFPFWNGNAPALYSNAITKFPNVRSCLVASEKDKENPDLRLINWDGFFNWEWTRNVKGSWFNIFSANQSAQTDANVCLWRIYTSLGTDERIERWKKFHGFPERGNIKEFGPIFPTRGLSHFLGWGFSYAQMPQHERDKEGKLIKTYFEYSTL